MYCTLQQDISGRFTEGDGKIVTDALARIAATAKVYFLGADDLPGVMRHGGMLIVEQHLDEGLLGQAVFGVRFYPLGFMRVLSSAALKGRYPTGVIYGNFEDYLCISGRS
jgi:hypothetical protein